MNCKIFIINFHKNFFSFSYYDRYALDEESETFNKLINIECDVIIYIIWNLCIIMKEEIFWQDNNCVYAKSPQLSC